MPGPLNGVKVLEFVGLGPGPFACTLLADLGAQVLRIDRVGAPPGGEGLGFNRATVNIDLRSEAGLAEVLALVAQADIVVEGFRPGVMERLGLGPDVLLGVNPRLVYGRMTGWGQEGPQSKLAGHDINYLSLTGALHAIGEAGRKPVPPLNLVADFGGGSLFLVVGVLAALQARTADGGGQVVDTAMVDGASYLMLLAYRMLGMGFWTDERGVNSLDGGAPFYGTYACSDGGYMAIGPLEPQFYALLLSGLGLDPAALPVQNDPAGWDVLRARITERFFSADRAHWSAVFHDSDACVSPVLSMTEAPHGEHLASRGTFINGVFGLEPAPAPRFSGTPAERIDGSAATLAAFGLAPGEEQGSPPPVALSWQRPPAGVSKG